MFPNNGYLHAANEAQGAVALYPNIAKTEAASGCKHRCVYHYVVHHS